MKETLQLLYLKLNQDIQCQKYKAKQFLTLSDALFQKMYHKSDEEEELTCSLLQSEAEPSSAQTEEKHSRNSQGNEQFQVQ